MMIFIDICKIFISISIGTALLMTGVDGKARIQIQITRNYFTMRSSNTHFYLDLNFREGLHYAFHRWGPSQLSLLPGQSQFDFNYTEIVPGIFLGNTVFNITGKKKDGNRYVHQSTKTVEPWTENNQKFRVIFGSGWTHFTWVFTLRVICEPHYFIPLRCITYCNPDEPGVISCDNVGRATCHIGWIKNQRNGCKDINECIGGRHTCNNREQCENTVGSYSCKCLPGYRGPDCEDVNECTERSHTCNNRAQCENTVGSYSCKCLAGYSGADCEDVNECTEGSHTCRHDALCENTVGSYSCKCPAGYIGTHCDYDINECTLPTACENNGVCVNNDGSYKCICPLNFIGPTCAINNDKCTLESVSPCQNGGTCTSLNGKVHCSCTSAFFGSRCEYQQASAAKASSDDLQLLGIVLGVALLAMMLFGLMYLLVLRKKMKKKRTGESTP